MVKPVILTVDDEVQVSNAIERDLKSYFSKDYRIIKTNSGSEALSTVHKLKQRDVQIALFLTDQRMPGMEGTEFLAEAIKIFPNARRVLLTAYADTAAAIRSINDLGVDYYLMKPWDPPEEKLYPVLIDLLIDWVANNRSKFEGIRVIGHQWSPPCHQAKDFLARNNIPYQWLDIEQNVEAKRLLELAGEPTPDLPYLIFTDGSSLSNPENREIAKKSGLQTIADQQLYDLVIIGGGPAGLAASVYGAAEGLRTLIIEQEAPGGQAGMSSRIENYLGFPNGISGGDLTHRAVTQARRLGVEILTAQTVVRLESEGTSKKLTLGDGNEVIGRSVLIASGVSYRKLEAKGISKLTGAGIYYGAAMSEGESLKGKDVFIVGGANSAGQAAMYFSRFANSVTMLVRSKSIEVSMSKYLIDQIIATANISIWTCTRLTEAIGESRLESIKIVRGDDTKEEILPANALFIFVGAKPHTDWLGKQIARDSNGFILAGPDIKSNNLTPTSTVQFREPYMLETSEQGVFVAGDVRHGSVKRVASAVGEGSMAVMYIHRHLSTI